MWILGRTYLFALAECNSEFPGLLPDARCARSVPTASRRSRACRVQLGVPGAADGYSLRSQCADCKSAIPACRVQLGVPGLLMDARCARSVPTASRRSRPAECNSEFPGPLMDTRCARSVPTASRRSRPAECNSELPGCCWMLAALAVCRLQVGDPGPAEYNSEFPGPLLDTRCARGMPTASRRSRGRYWIVRSCGKRMTSRMEAESVNSITSRSMPMPSPAVGGSAYSSARM